MSLEKYDYISEIENVKSSWKLKVRVLSIWKMMYELQMIVMDEKCDKIGAVVKQALCPDFEKDLEVGAVFMISRFGVGDNKGKYPVYMHKLKLNFYRNTSLRRVCSFYGPKNAFQFMPFSQVWDKKDHPNLLIDLIGRIVDCGDLKPYEKEDGGEGKRLNIEIEDADNLKLKCTWWDEYAQQMHDFIDGNKNGGPVVLIIQFGKIKYWKASSSQGAGQLSSKVQSVHDDFLTMPKMTIGEVIDATKPAICVVLATITSVEERPGWNYISCRKCKKKVVKKSAFDLESIEESVGKNDEDDGKLYCSKCKGVASSVVPSYKVQVRVQDGSDTTSFVMFDREVTKLLRMSAVQLIEKQIEEGDEDTLPGVFKTLEEKRILFMINVSSYNIDTVYQVYTVTKISNDPSIMAEFDNNQPGDDDQDDDHGGDFEKAGNSNTGFLTLKDVTSYTGDSSNALEATSETAASPLKCPVDAVEDDGIGENSSTKKKMFVPVKIEK
ncbi:replication protein A 70 kDa DNA-binding subunit B-like [Rutidosis leptorrhynchoides]|uniref:replication protein A 70 kDa DNA-binding subunit B-like n=1 Tax=Rutidosis leptorrhynchoides TaxID=125765 RepID=UPI003A994B51